MKWFPLIGLLFLMSCEEKIQEHKEKVIVETGTQESTFASKAIVHLSPRIKIDMERQEIEVTGHSGQLCGIDFLDGQILRYEVLNENELELVMETETLKLTRIHHSQKETGVYGTWQNVDFKEETAKNRERIVTFFIRDHEIMEVDVYCEQKEGKLFEEFQ